MTQSTPGHGADPLDYLYEELPPEGMAEARRHFGECPECRAAMREIRETVKQYRLAERPAPPEGLAARAARAAVAGAGREPAGGRLERVEKDFEKLKDEVRGAMRTGWWRRWFFPPAWTVAAVALLAGGLAIHFAPRGRDGLEARESASPGSAAREIRNRVRIPAAATPRSGTEPEAGGEAGVDMPPVLAEARARQDLPLPALAPETVAAAPKTAAMPSSEPVVSTPLPEEQAASFPMERLLPAAAPLLSPDELAALVDAPAPADGDADAAVVLDMAAMEPPQLIDRPEGFDQAERVRTLATLAGMQIAADEIADAWKTVDMLRSYDPAAADEIAFLLTEKEKAAAPAAAPEAPVRVRLAERPRPSGPTEQPAAETPEPEPEAAPPAPPVPEAVPAAAPEPEPVSVFSLPHYTAPMVEPPGEPPLSVVIVPFVPEPVPEAPAPGLRQSLEPSRSAALARTLTGYSGGSAPIYSEPIADMPPQGAAVRDVPLQAEGEPRAGLFGVSVQRGPRERTRFTTDPYLRDD